MARKSAPPVTSMKVTVPFMAKPVPSAVPVPNKVSNPVNSPETAHRTFNAMKTARRLWDPLYQAVAEMVDANNGDFGDDTAYLSNGSFTQDQVYDSAATRCAQVAGAAFTGMLWPNGAGSVKVTVKSKKLSDNAEIKQWMRSSNVKWGAAVDDPAANLGNALGELLEDAMKYGTVSLTRSPCPDEPGEPLWFFESWNVRFCWIAAGKRGQADRLAISYEMTAEQMVKDFGLNNCHKVVQDAYNTGNMDAKFKYLQLIQPRYGVDPKKSGPLNARISSCHYDLTNMKLMKESGFNRRAFYCLRFYRRPNQLYAYSPATNCLPDIYTINALNEAVLVATEKGLDPALGIIDDSAMGNAVVDTSAGGVSVFNPVPGGGNQPPVFQIQTIAEMRSAEERIARLENNIKDAFFIDRLLDLNNETEMTAREALIRNAMRSTTLRTPINRAISDVFTPLVQDTWMDMLDRHYFGFIPGSNEHKNAMATKAAVEKNGGFMDDIPLVPQGIADALARGEQVFDVEYLTPAMRDQKSDETQAIVDQIGLNTQLSAAYPQAKNQLKILDALDRIAANKGVPNDLMTSKDERASMEQEQLNQQQQEQQMAAAERLSGVAKNIGARPVTRGM